MDTDHLWGIGGDADWVWRIFRPATNPLHGSAGRGSGARGGAAGDGRGLAEPDHPADCLSIAARIARPRRIPSSIRSGGRLMKFSASSVAARVFRRRRPDPGLKATLSVSTAARSSSAASRPGAARPDEHAARRVVPQWPSGREVLPQGREHRVPAAPVLLAQARQMGRGGAPTPDRPRSRGGRGEGVSRSTPCFQGGQRRGPASSGGTTTQPARRAGARIFENDPR